MVSKKQKRSSRQRMATRHSSKGPRSMGGSAAAGGVSPEFFAKQVVDAAKERLRRGGDR